MKLRPWRRSIADGYPLGSMAVVARRDLMDSRLWRWDIVVGHNLGSMAVVAARQGLVLRACKGTLLLISAPMTMSDYVW